MFFKDRRQPTSTRALPLLPLRDLVVFPHMVVPLIVGREKSIATLNAAAAKDKTVFLAAQHDPKTTDPSSDDICEVGTTAVIIQMLRLPDGTVKVLVEGRRRGKIERYVETQDMFRVEVEDLDETSGEDVESSALIRQVKEASRPTTSSPRTCPPRCCSPCSRSRTPASWPTPWSCT